MTTPKTRKPKGPSESQIQKAILETLTAKRIWCWRCNSGGMVAGGGADRRYIRLAPAGTPDIMGAILGGKMFGFEVKAPRGKQSESQVLWQLRAHKEGVFYAVVRSVSEALEWIDKWEIEGYRP
jgi:hypothetical protein